jgi:hydroxypyruvate isomerase
MPRFAANLGFLYPEHDFLDRFAAAARDGFGAVEFAAPYAYEPALLAEKLRESGLACNLLNLPAGDKSRGDFGIACRPERREEFRQGITRGIAYAKALGCPRMNCISGTSREGDDMAALRETLLSNLRLAAGEFKKAGLELVIEPINTHDVPGFFVPRCGDGAALVAEVGADNFGLQCDLYHAAMMGDDPLATLRAHHSVIRHIQFADAPGRAEPGTGRLDMAALFAEIDRLGYAEWVAAEYRPSRATSETLGWMRKG